MAETFTPPKAVQSAAERGLEMRREHDRGGTMIGVTRARDLSNGAGISIETIGRMVSFFARHDTPEERAARERDETSPANIAWLLWGGDAGREWAKSIWDRAKEEKSADINVRIVKSDDENRVVSLILSVAEEADGMGLRDLHGDVIDAEDLQRVAWDYMLNHRMVGINHDILDDKGRVVGKSHGACVGSYVLTRTLQKALGLTDGALPVMWLVDLHVPDDKDWEYVKTNGLMGSIGGMGVREEVDE